MLYLILTDTYVETENMLQFETVFLLDFVNIEPLKSFVKKIIVGDQNVQGKLICLNRSDKITN